MTRRREVKRSVLRTLAAVVFLQFSCLNSGFSWVTVASTNSHAENLPFFTLLLSQFVPSYRNFFGAPLPTETPFLKDVQASIFSAFGKSASQSLKRSYQPILSLNPAALFQKQVRAKSTLFVFVAKLTKGLFKTEISATEKPQEGSPKIMEPENGAVYHGSARLDFSLPKQNVFLRPRAASTGGISHQKPFLDAGAFAALSGYYLHRADPPPGLFLLNWCVKILMRRTLQTGSGYGNRDGGIAPSKFFDRAPNFSQRIGRFYFVPAFQIVAVPVQAFEQVLRWGAR